MKYGNHILGLAIFAALGAAPEALAAQDPFAQPASAQEEASEVTRVEVRNHNFLDVNVYAWNGAQRMRLGSVSGLSTRSLAIPRSLLFGVSSLRFELDPIGRRGSPVTNEVSVLRGEGVILTVPPTGL